MTAAHRFTPDLFRNDNNNALQQNASNNGEEQQQDTPTPAQWFSPDPADNGFYADEEDEGERKAFMCVFSFFFFVDILWFFADLLDEWI